MKTDFSKILVKVNYSNCQEALNKEIEKYEKRFHQILTICRQKKNERDHIDTRESNTPSLLNSSTKNGNFKKKILAAN